MRRSLIALAFLACTGTADAADCAGLEASQTELNECFDAAYRAADAELNAVYRQVSQRLARGSDGARLLVAAQKSWIGFRDAECRFTASGAEGGSAQPTITSQCLDALTRKRTGDLKAYLHCPEGDLACPLPRAE